MKDHIAAGQHKKNMLWYGLFFVNNQTPSGCPRPMLSKSTKTGFCTQKDAIEEIKKSFSKDELNEIDFPENY